MKKKRRKTKKVIKRKYTFQKKDNSFSSQIVVIVIAVITIVLILLSYSNKPVEIHQPTQESNIETPASDIVIYPDSKLGVVSKVSDQITYNYIAPDNVSYPDIISYFINEMDKNGWNLTVSDTTQAVFEKGDRKVRVWILYLDVRPGSSVEYIIDYSP